MAILRKAIILLTVVLLIGCGGGGNDGSTIDSDGEDPGSSPSITNLDLHRGSDPYILMVDFDFEDPDGDISTLTTKFYDGTGLLLFNGTDTLENANGITDGFFRGEADFSLSNIGAYSITLYLSDEKENDSSALSGSFQVEGGFGSATQYSNEANYLYLGDTAIGDLNGDGFNDVAVINGLYNNGPLSIYYHQASSDFLESPIIIDPGVDTNGIAIADVNNDGNEDLIISGEVNIGDGSPGRIIVMPQETGSGQFGDSQEYIVNSYHTYHIRSMASMAVGDLNEDDRNDIVILYGNRIAIFFQNNEGTLDPEVDITMSSENYLHFYSDIVIADMNNDGKNDLISQFGKDGMAVIKQISSGEFDTTPDIYAYTGETEDHDFFSFAVGDFNDDYLSDVAVFYRARYGLAESIVDYFIQNSSGTLEEAVQLKFSDRDSISSMVVSDVTGDGLDDILVNQGGTIYLYRQTYNGFSDRYDVSYYYARYFNATTWCRHPLSIGDVTGDGRLDAVTTFRYEGLYVLPYANTIIID